MRRDKRVERSRAAVMSACQELVCQRGVGGVSVEGVAELSGVAKTTIYRHWPSREALLADTLCSLSAPPEIVPGVSVRSDLEGVLRWLATSLVHERWPVVLPSVLDAATRDPELARAHRQLRLERRAPLTDALARAVARGELPAGLDVERAVDLLAGPLFYRRLLGERPADEPGFVEAVVDGALHALGARERCADAGVRPADGRQAAEA